LTSNPSTKIPRTVLPDPFIEAIGELPVLFEIVY
jgi:hypothetical protein